MSTCIVSTRRQCILALGVLLGAAGCGDQAPAPAPIASVETVSDPQLARDLQAAAAGSINSRCEALKRIRDYWSPERAVLGGFSDLPQEVPQPPPKAIPAGDLEAIATMLQSALADQNDQVREAAAICLANAPEPSPAVNAAIAVALNSPDSSVLWYLWQLDHARVPLPEPGPFVPNLIRHLKAGGYSSAGSACTLIAHFGKQFVHYAGDVIDALAEIPEDDKSQVLLILGEIGLSEDVADKLVQRVANDTPDAKAAAFVALLSFPGKAARLLRDHPELGEKLPDYDGRWCWLLYSTAPADQELRDLLIATPGLGPVNLALIGSPDSIPELTRELEAADSYHKWILRACLRACGGELGEVVHLSEEKPVPFRPKSAWPESDPRRKSDASGHGDGFTEILITGELKFADGEHPDTIQFFRTNDEMLLGETRSDPMPVKYEPATGRFVLRTTVFAAYDVGKPRKPGPYQTGSAQVQVECPDCRPLVVQFFDEMPHVVIELRRK